MYREVEKAVRVAIDYIAIDVEGVQGREYSMSLRERTLNSPEVVKERILECIITLFHETPVIEERTVLEKVSKLLNVDSGEIYRILRECVAKGILCSSMVKI